MDSGRDATLPQLDEALTRMGIALDTVHAEPGERVVLTGRAPAAGGAVAVPAAAAFVLGPVIGQGGMGVVQVAEQTSLGREVAVKRLRPEVRGAESTRSLLQEAWVTGALEHPNIVPVYHLELEGDDPLIVMKRIEGVPWSECLADPSRLPGRTPGHGALAQHLEILVQVCNAVHFAHSKRIVHRDLKPQNVMIGGFGEVYVLDWGIAMSLDPDGAGGRFPTARDQGGIAGTPSYLAPEMALGDPHAIDERTDVYLLGATLHQIVTGRPRHGGANLREILAHACASAPVNYGPEVPAELAAVCNRATDVDPARRFATAEALRDAVRDFLGHQASVELAREASARLEQDHFGESRFGFQQALRIWPDNDDARRGLVRALEAMIDLEIRRENLGTAEALLSEMPDGGAEQRAAVERLAARLRKRQGEVAALRAFESEHDLRRGSRARSYAALMMAVASISNFVLYFMQRAGMVDYTAGLFLLHGVGPLAVIGIVVAVFWRGLTQNRANRQILSTLVTVGSVVVVYRILVVLTGQPREVAFAFEYLFWGMGFLTAAVFGERRLIPGALLLFAGGVAGALAPAHVLLSAFASAFTSMVWMAYVWWPRAGAVTPAGRQESGVFPAER